MRYQTQQKSTMPCGRKLKWHAFYSKCFFILSVSFVHNIIGLGQGLVNVVKFTFICFGNLFFFFGHHLLYISLWNFSETCKNQHNTILPLFFFSWDLARFGTTWEWVNVDRIFVFEWTLKRALSCHRGF